MSPTKQRSKVISRHANSMAKRIAQRFPDVEPGEIVEIYAGTADVRVRGEDGDSKRVLLRVPFLFPQMYRRAKVKNDVLVGYEDRRTSKPMIINMGFSGKTSVHIVEPTEKWPYYGQSLRRSHFIGIANEIASIGAPTLLHTGVDVHSLRVGKHGLLLLERDGSDVFKVRNIALSNAQTSWVVTPEPAEVAVFPTFLSTDGDAVYVNLFSPIVKLNGKTGETIWTTAIENSSCYVWSTPMKIGKRVWAMHIDYSSSDEQWTIRSFDDASGAMVSNEAYPWEELVPWRTRSFTDHPPGTVWEFPLTGASLDDSVSNGGDYYWEDVTIEVDLLNGDTGLENLGVWQDWIGFPDLGIIVPRLVPDIFASSNELWAWNCNTNSRKWVDLGFNPSEVNYVADVDAPDENAEVPLSQEFNVALLGCGKLLLTAWEKMEFQQLSGVIPDEQYAVELNKNTSDRILRTPADFSFYALPSPRNGIYTVFSSHGTEQNILRTSGTPGAIILAGSTFGFRHARFHQLTGPGTLPPFIPEYPGDKVITFIDYIDGKIEDTLDFLGPRSMSARVKSNRTWGYKIRDVVTGATSKTYTHSDPVTLAGSPGVNLGNDTFNSIFEGDNGPCTSVTIINFTIPITTSLSSQTLREYMEANHGVTAADRIDLVIHKIFGESFGYQGDASLGIWTQNAAVEYRRLNSQNGNAMTISSPGIGVTRHQPTLGTDESGSFDTGYQEFWVEVRKPIHWAVTDTNLPPWDILGAVANKSGTRIVFLPGRNGGKYPDKTMVCFNENMDTLWLRVFSGVTGTIQRSNGVINQNGHLLFWMKDTLYLIDVNTGEDVIDPIGLAGPVFSNAFTDDLVMTKDKIFYNSRPYSSQSGVSGQSCQVFSATLEGS